MYNGTGVIWISVSDLSASKSWYERCLQVKFLMQPRPNQWIGAGPISQLGIGLTEVDDPVVSEISPLTVGTDDLNRVVSHLASLGETPSEEMVVIPQVVKVAVFKDPNGHKLTFSELLSGG